MCCWSRATAPRQCFMAIADIGSGIDPARPAVEPCALFLAYVLIRAGAVVNAPINADVFILAGWVRESRLRRR